MLFVLLASIALALPVTYNPFTGKLDYYGLMNGTCAEGYAITVIYPNGTFGCMNTTGTIIPVDWAHVVIGNETVVNSSIGNAVIINVTIYNSTMSNAEISNATIDNARIMNTTIDNASITNANINNLTIGDYTYDNTSGMMVPLRSACVFGIQGFPDTGLCIDLSYYAFAYQYLGDKISDTRFLGGEDWKPFSSHFYGEIVPSDLGIVIYNWTGKTLPMMTMNNSYILGALFSSYIPSVQDSLEWGLWTNSSTMSLVMVGLMGAVDTINLLSGRMKLSGAVEIEGGGLNTNGTSVMYKPTHYNDAAVTMDLHNLKYTAFLNSSMMADGINLSFIADDNFSNYWLNIWDATWPEKRINFTWTDNQSIKLIRIWWYVVSGSTNYSILFHNNSNNEFNPIPDHYGGLAEEKNSRTDSWFENPAFLSEDKWTQVLGYYFPPQLYEIYTDVETDQIIFVLAGGNCTNLFNGDRCGIHEIDILDYDNYIDEGSSHFNNTYTKHLNATENITASLEVIGNFTYDGSSGLIGCDSNGFYAFRACDGIAGNTGMWFDNPQSRYELHLLGSEIWWLNVLTQDMMVGGDANVSDLNVRDGTIYSEDADLTLSDNVIINENLSVTGDISGRNLTSQTSNVSGEAMGQRMLMIFNKAAATTDGYIGLAGVGTGETDGWVMPRAGSVVGFTANLNISSETGAGDIEIYVLKNKGNITSITNTTSGVGNYNNWITLPRNQATFAAGDVITLYMNLTTFTGTVIRQFEVLELQFDT